MAIELQKDNTGCIVEMRLSGRLSRQDYEEFIPRMERLINEHGKLDLLVLMHDFHGWDFGGLWEDTRFAFKHYGQIERIALVGETKWQKGMSFFCKPFTKAEIHYFDFGETDRAREWLRDRLAAAA